MKRISLTIAFTLIFVFPAFAQKAAAKFPGVTATAKQKLDAAKRITPIPLPTWVPEGFKISRINLYLGTEVKIEDRQLVVIYSRALAGGKVQRFAIEAGFDGIGDLMYPEEYGKNIKSPVGNIWLIYQPKDEDGKVIKDFAMTEWFNVGKTAFHYVGSYGTEEGDAEVAMIPKADTERILRSLERYK